ncbi:hypothetical protein TNCV_4277701 [Trichonephila clavipes]|nr:hypothetical protein TNCV_4277701 [Trichonephila clavipes]
MNKLRKTSTGLNCLIVLSEEFIAADDDNMCTSKDILNFVQRLKHIIHADYSDDENEVNYAAHVPTSSETRYVMKSIRSHLDVHPNGQMNKKLDIIK